MNHRVSSTTLESFRRVTQEEYAKESELVASIMGEDHGRNWQAVAGTAWHLVLEDPGRYHVELTSPHGHRYPAYAVKIPGGHYTFSFRDVELALLHIGGGGVWELKRTKTYRILGADVDLVAKVDWARGLTIQDNKSKFADKGDPADYEGSLQWRCYLDVHEAAVVQYNLWPFREPKGGNMLTEGHLSLKDEVSWVRFWRYPELEEDIVRWLTSFIRWTRMHRLDSYLLRAGTT